jgi:catechol 2,3-dioxygenase-like lactoylglutathione lyase family enzyme
MHTVQQLGNSNLIALVTIRDVKSAKHFYRDTLGLRLVSEELPFALVFDANGTMLRLAISPQHVPLPGTVLGWRVDEIQEHVRQLASGGVVFERFEGMPQDELGIWSTPTGAKVAWFKDPDGNLLSVSEHP